MHHLLLLSYELVWGGTMGNTYVMSDLHGQYDRYVKMLNMIELKDDDMLYILGDILDRGPNPIKIIMDLMERPNVEVIAGNHEVMALECMDKFLLKEINEDSINEISRSVGFEALLNWQTNGAHTTIQELHALDRFSLREVKDFIADFEMYDEVNVGGVDYILVHAGLDNFEPDRELWDYDLYELVWGHADYQKVYFEDKILVTGHTPTAIIDEAYKGKIYKANYHIAIDCGCSFPGGRLGCIRLDDMKEFYVD